MKQIQFLEEKLLSLPFFLRIGLGAIPLIVFSTYLICLSLSNRTHIIYPNSDYTVFSFTDKWDEGKSEIIKMDTSNNQVSFDFQFKEGLVVPYAGINISKPKDELFDLSGYDELNFEFTHSNIRNFSFDVETFEEGFTKRDDVRTFRNNIIYAPAEEIISSYKVSFSSLTIAAWFFNYYDKNSTDLADMDLSRVKCVSVTGQRAFKEGKPSNITLQSLSVKNNLFQEIIFSLICLIIIYGGAVLYVFIKRKVGRSKIKIEYETTERKTQKDDSPIEQIAKYINVNYHNPEMTLAHLSNIFPWPEKQISSIIKENYPVKSFREYVNGIRIEEAKRLLMKTDKSVSEIGYEVGFNSPNAFNRVFKQFVNVTPGEFALNKK